MWEWEAPPDDEGGGPIDPSLIESQRLELERRKQQKKIESEINSIIDDRINVYKNMVQIGRLELQQLKEYSDKTQDLTQKREAAVAALQAARESTVAISDEQIEALEREAQVAKENEEKYVSGQKNIVKELLKTKTLGKDIKKELQEAFESGDPERIKKAIAKATAEFDNLEESAGDVDKAFSSLARSVGLSSNAMKSGLGDVVSGIARVGIAVAKNPFTGLHLGVNAIMGILSPLNLLGIGLGFLKQALMEVEESAADMTKAFGGGMEQNMLTLSELQGEALKYNIQIKELSKSYIALQGQISGFNKLSDVQKKSLAMNTSLMAKMGVEEKALAKQTQKLSYAFGGLGSGTAKAQQKIIGFAQAGQILGYTMSESVQILDQFGGAVSSMGGDITKELTSMMAMAKATGAELGKLISIAKKFNTFKEGADMAAKLNSVFGTSISQIELMGKTGKERNQIIADSLKNATGGYQSMTLHQRLAAAEMLGFGDDVEQLRAYMHGQSEAAKADAEAKKEQAANMEKLRQTAATMVPALTQLANEFKKAFIESGALSNMMQMISQNRGAIIEFFKNAAYLVGWLANNIDALTMAYAGLKMAQFAYIKLAPIFAGMTLKEIMLTNIAALSKMELGFATLFAIGGLLLIVGAFILVYRALTKRGSPPLYLMAGVMAIAVIALGVAMYYAGPAIYPVILALALLMAALALVFYMLPPLIDAISGLVGMITVLFTTMVSNVGSLYLVAGGLMAIGGAFLFLGNMAMLAALGIAAGSIALIALRATMALSGTSFEDLMSIGEGVSKMGEGIKALKEGISGLGAAGSELMKGLGDKNIMVTGDARGATVLAGKGGMFAFIPPKITVDVNMDDVEMAAPNVNVSVTLDGDELRHIISEEIASSR